MSCPPVCLYRPSLMDQEELEAAREAGFNCLSQRAHIPPGSLVVARYSALPFYRELEVDLQLLGSRLVNSHQEHEWIAHMDWAFDGLTQELTFPTWASLDQVPRDEAPFVLKGRTNSKKNRWSTHAYAETWEDALQVQRRLEEDGLIGDQGIVIRKYIPLKTYFKAIGGVPITKEFRVFVYKQQVLSTGYYWDAFRDDFPFHCEEVPPVKELNTMFVQQVINAVGDQATFYVADVAQEKNGDWWLVELNDGQMSGLSGNEAGTLYRAFYEALTAPEDTHE